LTSVFDFAAPDRAFAGGLPDTADLPAKACADAALPWPRPSESPAEPPRQEPGRRPARPPPYAFDVAGSAHGAGLELTIANTGQAGAGFMLVSAAGAGGPWYYAVDAGKSVKDELPLTVGRYDLTLHGPNTYLRRFRGRGGRGPEVGARYDVASEAIVLTLSDPTADIVSLTVSDAYAKPPARTHRLEPGGQVDDAWPIATAAHWYDITATSDDPTFVRRLAGHIETGLPSLSDPALG
jgi:phospholipase C